MKSLRKFCAAAILALAIAVPTYPGDISCPGVQDPPSPPPAHVCVAGDISCPGAPSGGNRPDAVDPADLDLFTELTLTLFQGLLSLF